MVLPRNPLKPVKRRRKKNQVCLPCFFCDITFLSFIDLFFSTYFISFTVFANKTLRVSSSSRDSDGSNLSSISQGSKRIKKDNQRQRKAEMESKNNSEIHRIRKNWPAGRGPSICLRVGRQRPFKAFYGICMDDLKRGGYLMNGQGGPCEKIKGKIV